MTVIRHLNVWQYLHQKRLLMVRILLQFLLIHILGFSHDLAVGIETFVIGVGGT